MDIHAWIAVATLVTAMVLFISKLIPLEATALSIPIVLAVTGTVNPSEAALRGFGNSAVISLGAIFVLSAGLKESGVATLMGRLLERFGGKNLPAAYPHSADKVEGMKKFMRFLWGTPLGRWLS